MRDTEDNDSVLSLAGSLLLASPKLLDPNFQKAVILLSVHSEDDGALGVIINRPSGHTLGEYDDTFADSILGSIPVYEGGPVSTDQVILSAWKCEPQSGIFKLYFGISEEKAIELKEQDPTADIRGFLGYAGWTSGQLESELKQDAWMISPVNTQAMTEEEGTALWRTILTDIEPDFGLLPEAPEDPSVN